MRSSLPLNDDWRFAPDFRDEYLSPAFDDAAPGSGFSPVRVPHTSSVVPYAYFDERDHQGECCYRRLLPSLSAFEPGYRAVLRFEGVMAYAEAYVNGARVGEHKGGYTPFSFDITDFLRGTEPSSLCLKVDTRERADIPPFGGVVDYLCYGGVYREAHLEALPAMRVSELVVRTRGVLSVVPEVELRAALNARAGSGLRAACTVRPIGFDDEVYSADGTLSEDGAAFHCVVKAPRARLWGLDSPSLYTAEVCLYDGLSLVDRVSERFGFREAVFKTDGFFLNGVRVKLRGLNRHQSFPYVGSAMPCRVQRHDADILKSELGCNVVRSSHYPPSAHFLDRCDEIGLLVFEELPGWRHIGGAGWKETALANLAEMIIRDRNRPSVVLWGTRINESGDDDEFYARTNALAKKLDPARQTGGVRDLEGSRLLEDVYTFNDFTHDGSGRVLKKCGRVARRRVPYLVTEHNGHMFPTKKFDAEERRVEHALRHLRVLNAAYADNEIAGAIGWCMADYNTHREFGSGDRICRHGVLDMFRIGKYAAAAYASQRDGPPFGFVASELRVGDRNGGNIDAVPVFTNADRVKVFKNDRCVGVFFPARRAFPALPHPPVIVDDLIGDSLSDELPPRNAARLKSVFLARMRGRLSPIHYLRAGLVMLTARLGFSDIVSLFTRHAAGWGGSAVVYRFEGYTGARLDWTIEKGGSSAARTLELRADDNELREGETWDATRVEVRLLDALGNVLPYCFDPVELSIRGPAEVLGPSVRPLEGGSTAFWVRTIGEAGTVSLTALCGAFTSEPLKLAVFQKPV